MVNKIPTACKTFLIFRGNYIRRKKEMSFFLGENKHTVVEDWPRETQNPVQ
jgi:hypothetical protein